MSAKSFVDTNVLVYAHDAAAGERHLKARELVAELWRERSGAVSTQVLQELYVSVRRKAAKPLARPAARRLVADYLSWHVVVNDGDSILAAVDLERRYRLSFWDALIVQAANTAAADVLYSEDLSHGQNYGQVTVVNPLLAG